MNVTGGDGQDTTEMSHHLCDEMSACVSTVLKYTLYLGCAEVHLNVSESLRMSASCMRALVFLQY
jgi:hypothetical protein